jgi:hypothetical protein
MKFALTWKRCDHKIVIRVTLGRACIKEYSDLTVAVQYNGDDLES